jgi:hypothetical protein
MDDPGQSCRRNPQFGIASRASVPLDLLVIFNFMVYRGTIIEESLEDKNLLKDVVILSTQVEPVTEAHQTPWLKQWTLHKVEIPEERAAEVAEKIGANLDYSHKSAWYADFKNKDFHYIIFKDKIFKISRNDVLRYQQAKQYGMSLGIPEHQVGFSPEIE